MDHFYHYVLLTVYSLCTVGKTTGKTSVHLVHHAVKHLVDALIGYMIYLCFTDGVKN